MSTLTEKIRRAVGRMEERQYTVEGSIVFVFKPPIATELGLLTVLRKAIEEVDEKFPWREDKIPEGVEPKSIHYLGKGNVIIHNISPRKEQHIWFMVVPQYDSMRRAQTYAYEKYLTKLAEELAKRRVPYEPWADEVRSVIKITASKTFRAQ